MFDPQAQGMTLEQQYVAILGPINDDDPNGAVEVIYPPQDPESQPTQAEQQFMVNSPKPVIFRSPDSQSCSPKSDSTSGAEESNAEKKKESFLTRCCCGFKFKCW